MTTRPSLVLPLLLCVSFGPGCGVHGDHSAAPLEVGPEDAQDDPRVLGLEPQAGLLPVFTETETGRVWLELPPADSRGVHMELIWAVGLRQGLGHQDLGLDRGEYGRSRLIRFRALGGRVAVEVLNTNMVASSEDPAERRAVEDSFVSSIAWSGEVAGRDEDGRVRVEISALLTDDHLGLRRRLARAEQGAATLDPERSGVELEQVLVFPNNLEFDAALTFDVAEPGDALREVAPDPERISIVAHHSFVALPEPGFEPRIADPRVGLISLPVLDFGAALDDELRRELAVHHRLRPGQPIVYYVDRGAPEPVRGALLDGARWWAEAFAAAGHPGTFEVELLPEGVHPMDARYNVISWVHRAGRGWSFGGAIIDPRSGEIIKGNVTLGSQRIRQDRRIFEGLLGANETGSGGPEDPLELSLARVRQLAAHEVGHTLGLAHNFAASTYGRASVMDYPAPLITLSAEVLDASAAYGVGTGAWDHHAIAWLYAELDDNGREALVAQAASQGMIYLGEADARALGSADPRGSLWDNGSEPAAELRRMLELRRFALTRFGADRLHPARSLDELELVFATVYFAHRYQLRATAKAVGGRWYQHTRAEDPPTPVRVVPAPQQREALATVLEILAPAALDIPEPVLASMQPGPPSRERLATDAAPLFDPLGAAGTAAEQVYAALLHPARMLRLVDQHRRDPAQLSLEQTLRALSNAVLTSPKDPRLGELSRSTRRRLVAHLARLYAQPELRGELRGRVSAELRWIDTRLSARQPGTVDGDERDDRAALRDQIQATLDASAPALPAPTPASEMPPGSPIGHGAAGCSQPTRW